MVEVLEGGSGGKLSHAQLMLALTHVTDVIQWGNVARDEMRWFGDLPALIGWEPAEIPTITRWTELLHPDDRDRVERELDEIVRAGGEGWTFRYRIRAKDGSYRHWLDRGSFVAYVDGVANEGVGGIIDETRERLALAELEVALSEIQKLTARLQAEGEYLRTEIAAGGFGEIVGCSPSLSRVLETIDTVAPTNATVLLEGETGTGKELLVRTIHARSRRSDRPLIKVACGSLPPSLIESELFGHEKGAFTGAHKARAGLFELADKGTIFLDEIGELPIELQPKLLQILDDGEAYRVGGTAPKAVDVRVIAATHRDLRTAVREDEFRADLYYRLSVFPIQVPPLRDRSGDVELLAEHFVETYAGELKRPVTGIAPSSMDALMAYDWPGNVRELRNVIERSVILAQGDTVTVEGLPGVSEASLPPRASDDALKASLDLVERDEILRALEASAWKIKGEGNAASQLSVSPSGLRAKMKRLGISRPI